jgi:hypothetical protein
VDAAINLLKVDNASLMEGMINTIAGIISKIALGAMETVGLLLRLLGSPIRGSGSPIRGSVKSVLGNPE